MRAQDRPSWTMAAGRGGPCSGEIDFCYDEVLGFLALTTILVSGYIHIVVCFGGTDPFGFGVVDIRIVV